MTNDNETYNALDDGFKSHGLALREIRLEGIRAGRFTPRNDDAEEMEVAREAGFHIVQPEHHRRSA